MKRTLGLELTGPCSSLVLPLPSCMILGKVLNHVGKLEVVKQEMASVNVDILGISKLKWTGMGEFNSDDHYIYNIKCEDSEETNLIFEK